MTKFNLPEQHNLQVAADEARKTLQSQDAALVAARSGAQMQSEAGRTYLNLTFCLKKLRIEIPEYSVTLEEGTPLSDFETVLVLHYLLAEDPKDEDGEWVSFQQIKDGAFYYPTFRRRSCEPISSRFSGREKSLLAIGQKHAFKPFAHGDASCIVPLLPNLDAAVVLWAGEPGLPGDANVLFRISASHMLSAEDLAVAGSLVAATLARLDTDAEA